MQAAQHADAETALPASMTTCTGRFAPTPSGPLHAGSVVAALASWLDARAHRGRWLVRIEDTDTPRCVPGAAQTILSQLAALGLHPDEEPVFQSMRTSHYRSALDALQAQGQIYPCGCSRSDIEQLLRQQGQVRLRHAAAVYPGTCRDGLSAANASKPLAWRVRCGTPQQAIHLHWLDRRLGAQHQDLTHEVGDFVVLRADGLWSYQLAVVVDDALQGITHVVRGEDLADNTARQIHLQSLLGLPTPQFLHTPLVMAADGQKLSKQNGAQSISAEEPLSVLRSAAVHLGLPALSAQDVSAWLEQAVHAWQERWLNTSASG